MSDFDKTPLPARNWTRRDYRLEEMAVGASLWRAYPEGNTLHSAASRFKRNNPSWDYRSQQGFEKRENLGLFGVRIWRTK